MGIATVEKYANKSDSPSSPPPSLSLLIFLEKDECPQPSALIPLFIFLNIDELVD